MYYNTWTLPASPTRRQALKQAFSMSCLDIHMPGEGSYMPNLAETSDPVIPGVQPEPLER